jgi:lactoylglutathione lyase
MIKKLEHVGIVVSDIEKSISFYQEVFDLLLRHREYLNDTVELAFLHHPSQPDMEIELISGKIVEHNEGKVHHIAFRVENLEEELLRLKELGVELTDENPRVVMRYVKIAFLKGPDGEILELVER